MHLNTDRISEIWRYYQAGILNALFGFGLYSLFIWLGINMFLSQIIAHVLGVAFNYLTYSRHVFRSAAPAKTRFILSYGVNYLVSLAALFLLSLVVKSPYVAGFLSIFVTSVINYFALRHLVFFRKAAE